MADTGEKTMEVGMEEYLYRYVLPLAALLIVLRIIYIFMKKCYPIVYAFIVDRFSVKHHKLVKEPKKRLLSGISSLCKENQQFFVLEIGCGPGRNFEFYPENTVFTAVEPNEKFQKYVAENIAKVPKMEVGKFLTMGAEDLREHVNDSSQDVVVSTMSLCSVRDVEAVVSEVLRVLKPGGRFYFIEHTRAHKLNSWTHLVQRILTPVLKVVAGCNPARTPWTVIDRAGFSQVKYTKDHLKKGLIVARPHLFGYAVK